MSDFKCSACQEEFCRETNQPRLFPDCGHSVCTLCLEGLLLAGVEVTCPEDDTPNSLFADNPKLGLDAFPVNFSLLPLLRVKPPNDAHGDDLRLDVESGKSDELLNCDSDGGQVVESSGEEGQVGYVSKVSSAQRSFAHSRDALDVHSGSQDGGEEGDTGKSPVTSPGKRLSDSRTVLVPLEPIEEETPGNNGDESPTKSPLRLASHESRMRDLAPKPFQGGIMMPMEVLAVGGEPGPGAAGALPEAAPRKVTSELNSTEDPQIQKENGLPSRRNSATKAPPSNQTPFEEDRVLMRKGSQTSDSVSKVVPPPAQAVPRSPKAAPAAPTQPQGPSSDPKDADPDKKVIEGTQVSSSLTEHESGPSFVLRPNFSEDLSPIKPPGSLPHRNPPTASQVCPIHSKPKDIVCLSDKCLICHKCALFGDHKLHDYKEIDSFKECIQEKVAASEELSVQLQAHRTMLDCQPLIASFKQKVENKRSVFLEVLAQRADEISTALTKRVAAARAKIDETFAAFGEAYSYVESNSSYLYEKNDELRSRLTQCAELLKGDVLDVGFFLDNFFGDLQWADQAKKLHEQILDFDSMSKAIIDNRLDVLRFDEDIKGVLAAIQSVFEVRKVNQEPEDKGDTPDKTEAKVDSSKVRTSKDTSCTVKDVNDKPKGAAKGVGAGKRNPPSISKPPKQTNSRTPSRKKGQDASTAKKESVGKRRNEVYEPKAPQPTPVSTKDQTPVMSLADKRNAKGGKSPIKQLPPKKEVPPAEEKRQSALSGGQLSTNSMQAVLNNLQQNSFQMDPFDTTGAEFTKNILSHREVPLTGLVGADEAKTSVSPISSNPNLDSRPSPKVAELHEAVLATPNIAKAVHNITSNAPQNTPEDQASLSDLSQHRSINEEDSHSKSFANSAEENLFNNDDNSDPSFEDHRRSSFRRNEDHPDGLFENDPPPGAEDSMMRQKAASFLKKNMKSKGMDLSGIQGNQKELNSPSYAKIRPEMPAEAGYTFQKVLQGPLNPNPSIYGFVPLNNAPIGPHRGPGMQQNFNNRYSQAQIPVQNFMDIYSRPAEGSRGVLGDGYEDADPSTSSHKKSFLNNGPLRHNSVYSVNQANLASLQIHSDFNDSRVLKPSKNSKPMADSDYEILGSSGRLQTNVPSATKSRMGGVQQQSQPAFLPLAKLNSNKAPPKEEMDTEMHFMNKAVNMSRLQDILAAVGRNPRVKTLNLSNNYINDKGVEMIVERLLAHPTLEAVILNGNDIEEEVFEMLLKKFRNNKKARTLFMRENKRFKNFAGIRKHIAALRKFNLKVEI